MKLFLNICVMMVMMLAAYVPMAKADYAIRMDFDTANRIYLSQDGAWWWGGTTPCANASWGPPKTLVCGIYFHRDYRDVSTMHVLSLVPRNDVYSNCFKKGTVWQIDIMDQVANNKILASYTYRYTAGTPVEWGTTWFIPAATIARARLSPDNLIGPNVVITPKAGTRSPLPRECVRSLSWQIVMPDWSYEWLGRYQSFP